MQVALATLANVFANNDLRELFEVFMHDESRFYEAVLFANDTKTFVIVSVFEVSRDVISIEMLDKSSLTRIEAHRFDNVTDARSFILERVTSALDESSHSFTV